MWTPLHYAMLPSAGNVVIAKELLRHGASVGMWDYEGWTPLHLAAANGQLDLCQMLLRHGANVEARDDMGFTPLLRAARCGKREVCQLLMDHGADLEASARDGRGVCDVAHHMIAEWIESALDVPTVKSAMDF
jgi:26S proteasome non-ATPase regulatory subunit 10